QAALIIGDPIPMPIVQFVTEHPEVVPRFLTTLEIGAGTITWDESMAAAGILTPEQVEDLDARRKTLVYKYESVLRQFANSATRLWGPSYDDQVEFFHEKHSFLQRCLLLICEYIDEDENISYSTVAFLTVLVGFILSQEDQIENPPQDIDPFLALPILAWVKESGHLIGGLTEEQIFAQARLIFGRLVRGDRKRILLYEP
ncbi:hypothetical protein, partial [Nitrosomonas nitrosa]|uniref:hypothetical protein n=1 Tax=Nitrosomonas nitrosa TaxID=52442 RepID=UPI0023F819F7